ncbi:hypothetical protein [Sinorhizobium chiapasense]|uniref:Uncharacterized protein n=1 Tax=Sinorhizobium chiapasense TaxID=501572 RepID=A0ABZ2BD94_9HYPH
MAIVLPHSENELREHPRGSITENPFAGQYVIDGEMVAGAAVSLERLEAKSPAFAGLPKF